MALLIKKISVISVVLEDHQGLRSTLDSVLSQDYKDLEIIVIDGGSTSNEMKNIFKIYDDKIVLVSEKDNGIYDAMNKGLSHASGDWVIFLNAGDTFFDNETLSLVDKHLQNLQCTYFGRAEITDQTGHSWLYPSKEIHGVNLDKWIKKSLPNHQAMFFPATFYTKNKFDLTFGISADSNYKIQALCGPSYFLDMPVCRFYLGGLSSDLSFKSLMGQFRERLRRKGQYGGVFFAASGLLKSLVKLVINFLFGKKAHQILQVLKNLIRVKA